VSRGYQFNVSFLDVETESYAVEGAVSGALTDNFYARLTAMYNDEGGWLDTNSRLSTDGLVQLHFNSIGSWKV
jgi:hypothetical protein